MGNKKNKQNLHGIEHLYQELDNKIETPEIKNVEQKDNTNIKPVIKEKSHLKKELVIIIVIMIVLFGVLGVILYFDNSNDFLLTLAEKLSNLY
ncbi:MAG: hypothetical protein ACNFW9_06210 [Candidatus Kerfeldbacteria bacterium]